VGAPETLADRRATISSVIRTRVVELSPDDSLREAEALMRMGRFRMLAVVSADRLEGVLRYAPMVRWCLAESKERGGSASGRLRDSRVAALMDAKPACAAPGDTLREVVMRLGESGCGFLPVVDASGRFLGIVTERDLLRAAYAPAHDVV
jgi:CBS domain-containing membrane protein